MQTWDIAYCRIIVSHNPWQLWGQGFYFVVALLCSKATERFKVPKNIEPSTQREGLSWRWSTSHCARWERAEGVEGQSWVNDGTSFCRPGDKFTLARQLEMLCGVQWRSAVPGECRLNWPQRDSRTLGFAQAWCDQVSLRGIYASLYISNRCTRVSLCFFLFYLNPD